MQRFSMLALAIGLSLLIATPATAGMFNGQADYQRDDLGYYYMITGGLFPYTPPPTGNHGDGEGGTFRFLTDDSTWGGYPLGQWNKDDWFSENSSFAVTLKNDGAIVYDNNGIETGTYGDYYDASGLAASAQKPGLYRGYSMSNNYDWIYAGFIRIEGEEPVEIDEIIGYFDPTAGFDPDSPMFEYGMNLWSDNPDFLPTNTGGFFGDILSSDTTSGEFTWGDTGVDRIFGADYGFKTDDIYRLTFTLDNPIVLAPGDYWFSHDARIVPEPASLLTFLSVAAIGAGAALRRRRQTA